MHGVVKNLETFTCPKGTILHNELDEIGEIIFVSKGKIGLGYEINKIKKIAL